jgi:hypothetical protein
MNKLTYLVSHHRQRKAVWCTRQWIVLPEKSVVPYPRMRLFKPDLSIELSVSPPVIHRMVFLCQ